MCKPLVKYQVDRAVSLHKRLGNFVAMFGGEDKHLSWVVRVHFPVPLVPVNRST
jgi:hypothetical protein